MMKDKKKVEQLCKIVLMFEYFPTHRPNVILGQVFDAI